MHHVPVGPPLSARIRATLRRLARAAGSAVRFRARRAVAVLLVGMAATVAAVVAFAVPALSGSRPPVSLDSATSNSADGWSPVVMGVDGRPVTATTARSHRRTTRSPSAAVGSTGATAAHPGTGTSTAARNRQTLAGSSTTPGRTRTSSPGPSTSSSTVTSSSSSSSSVSPSSSSSVSPPSAAASSSPSASFSPSSSASSSSSSSPEPAAPGYSDDVLELVNAARADAGCAALTPDAALGAAALVNSTDMAALGTPSVVDAAGTAAAVSAGEDDADSLVSTWLATDTDKGVLLDCGLTSAGVGKVRSDGGPWWTLFLS